jgi:hypothetical protein
MQLRLAGGKRSQRQHTGQAVQSDCLHIVPFSDELCAFVAIGQAATAPNRQADHHPARPAAQPANWPITGAIFVRTTAQMAKQNPNEFII